MSHDDFPTDNPAVVTCGLPYPTGDLHIGHLRTYVGGDVLARALRTVGQRTASNPPWSSAMAPRSTPD